MVRFRVRLLLGLGIRLTLALTVTNHSLRFQSFLGILYLEIRPAVFTQSLRTEQTFDVPVPCGQNVLAICRGYVSAIWMVSVIYSHLSSLPEVSEEGGFYKFVHSASLRSPAVARTSPTNARNSK